MLLKNDKLTTETRNTAKVQLTTTDSIRKETSRSSEIEIPSNTINELNEKLSNEQNINTVQKIEETKKIIKETRNRCEAEVIDSSPAITFSEAMKEFKQDTIKPEKII